MKKINFSFGTAVEFGNGVVILNTTPHPISIQDTDGSLVTVEPSVLINAKAVETSVGEMLVKTNFIGTEEGDELLDAIEAAFEVMNVKKYAIIGSIIAAQAYPGRVVGMCPVPGFERVAPSEKRMCCDKFTTFA